MQHAARRRISLPLFTIRNFLYAAFQNSVDRHNANVGMLPPKPRATAQCEDSRLRVMRPDVDQLQSSPPWRCSNSTSLAVTAHAHTPADADEHYLQDHATRFVDSHCTFPAPLQLLPTGDGLFNRCDLGRGQRLCSKTDVVNVLPVVHTTAVTRVCVTSGTGEGGFSTHPCTTYRCSRSLRNLSVNES